MPHMHESVRVRWDSGGRVLLVHQWSVALYIRNVNECLPPFMLMHLTYKTTFLNSFCHFLVVKTLSFAIVLVV